MGLEDCCFFVCFNVVVEDNKSGVQRFFFGRACVGCGIFLVPHPGIEPGPSAVRP